MEMSIAATDSGGVSPESRAWSLSRHFAIGGGLFMLAAAIFAGFVTSGILAKAALDDTATSTALFMDSFLSPRLQVLADSDYLPPDISAALDRLIESEAFEGRFPHLEIWKPDGLVVYSRTKGLVGKTFVPPEGLTGALEGKVVSRYADLSAEEHVVRDFSKKYLEIYVPVREDYSGRIIAVTEIHELPETIEAKLFDVRLRSWFAITSLTLLLMAGLFGIVHRGGRVIAGQQDRLQENVKELREVLEQNRFLRDRAQRATRHLSEMNTEYLRNVAAELHDGPAQLAGLAALKVGHIRRARSAKERGEELDSMDAVLADVIHDIRAISKGLMLPHIEELPLSEVVRIAAKAHETRTETDVVVKCGTLNGSFPHAVKICVYRVVQEGLNNAFKHAGGRGQSVSCQMDGTALVITVQDEGGHRNLIETSASENGLGLAGMRYRVESLGGSLTFLRNGDRGTTIKMHLELAEGA